MSPFMTEVRLYFIILIQKEFIGLEGVGGKEILL